MLTALPAAATSAGHEIQAARAACAAVGCSPARSAPPHPPSSTPPPTGPTAASPPERTPPASSPPDTSTIEVLQRPLDSGQFTSSAFTQRALDSGLTVSLGSSGDCLDNAVIESFWARMQVELLNRRRWKTRLELSNAIFEYLGIFHNRRRRHSSLGMLTPVEYELRHATTTVRDQAS